MAGSSKSNLYSHMAESKASLREGSISPERNEKKEKKPSKPESEPQPEIYIKEDSQLKTELEKACLEEFNDYWARASAEQKAMAD